MRLQTIRQELQQLRQESDCHAQSYEASHASAGTHSDPVAAYNAKILALESKLQRLDRNILPVLQVRAIIKNSHEERDRELFLMMELFYFEQMTLDDIALHLQKSRRTLSRRREELVNMVMREIV